MGSFLVIDDSIVMSWMHAKVVVVSLFVLPPMDSSFYQPHGTVNQQGNVSPTNAQMNEKRYTGPYTRIDKN